MTCFFANALFLWHDFLYWLHCSVMLLLICWLSTALLMDVTLSQDFQGYEFAANTQDLLVQPLVRSFSCRGRDYGYYADVANNCQIFHICWPKMNEVEEVVGMNQWSFVCGNQTVFDQATLSCNHVSASLPCDVSESLFGTVDFFKIS